MIGIIGGTGIYDPGIFRDVSKEVVETPYGTVPDVFIGKIGDRKAVFLPRHGMSHTVPPHRVNYRANIHAMKDLGVERIISTNSVGAVNKTLKPGDIVIPADFMDFTRSRPSTFFDEEVVHIDVSQAYCPVVRGALLEAAEKTADDVFDGGVYACTEGPRFETPAEIRMMEALGCDIVGMVGVPEVVLAREAELCYASICTVTNMAAGISQNKLTATEVVNIVKVNEEKLKDIVMNVIEAIPTVRGCGCKDALQGARM